MLECLILGDSIAVGVHSVATECAVQAQIGYTSGRYITAYPTSPDAANVLISLGSNDWDDALLQRNIKSIRSRFTGTVTWLLSANRESSRLIVLAEANSRGDRVLEVKPYVYKDGVHPTPRGYVEITNGWRQRNQ